MTRYVFLLAIVIAIFPSCTKKIYFSREFNNWEKTKSPDSLEIIHSIYLIGDVGAPFNKENNLTILSSMIEKDSLSSVIFLGDNIYPKGLPPIDDKNRVEAERILDRQIQAVYNYKGNVFFIPGNHDWDYMGKNGWIRVRAQENYIETKLNKGNTFVPDNGCPGPVRVSIKDQLVMIFIDTQWWLHDYNKPSGGGYGCTAVNKNDVIVQLRDIIERNKGKHVVIAAHHPLYSNGNHGGYYNALDHIFPLRLLNKNKWYRFIPLPVVGSLYPLYRKFGGVKQDLPSYEYQALKKDLMEVFKDQKEIIYAAGHDHNLQYFKIEDFHHIVSGSGCKVNPIRTGGDAAFIHKAYGFAKLNFYSNGEAWVEFYEAEGNSDVGKLSFRTMLYKKFEVYPEAYCSLSRKDYQDSTIKVAASKQYEAKKFKELLLGKHYRDVWATPITTPYLDLQTEKGGIIPYALGGGKQSLSLKFKNPDEQQYVARTVNKDPKLGAIPAEFKNTIVDDLVQDGISSQHPYGAVTVPPLADAIKVLHTNPKIAYIPSDSCLGPYYEKFKKTLVIFEEDPDEAHKDAPHLGFAEEIIGTDRVIEELQEDNDNKVDQYAYARARMLDMLIGDWDRHKRQYRWAEFKEENKGKTYVPVPEDHDQAYFNFDGIIPSMLNDPWAVRQLQHFDHEFKDIKGLNYSSSEIDRRFANSLTKQDWKSIADTIQLRMTNDVIESAIRRLPKEAFDLDGQSIINSLKSRRESLPKAIEKYYDILAKYVDVHGSNKHELFTIDRLNEKETKVTIYKVKKDGEIKETIYQRTFYSDETKEIRLYGLSGQDKFIVNGDVKDGILLRIIGGEGKDSIQDDSKVRGFKDHTIVYDSDDNTYLKEGSETRNMLSPKLDINDPDLDAFFYNYTGPVATLTYNQGDGIFLGAGLLYRGYKFRANPYGVRHKFLVSYAAITSSFKVDYNGDFRKIFGTNKDLTVDLAAYLPYFHMNFFGYGNDSPEPSKDIEFYRVRLHYIKINPIIVKRIRSFIEFGIGPKFESYQLERDENTLVSNEAFQTDDNIFQRNEYVGLKGHFKIGNPDNNTNPTRGIVLSGEAHVNQQINGRQRFYTSMRSDLTFYLTPNLSRQLTIAGRVGVARNDGDFFFYQAVPLGGINNLRGYYRTRFVGDKSFYQNLEVRLELFKLKTYLFAGKLGVAGFIDNGRVWPGKGGYHQGYGPGVWLNIINRFVLTGYYGFSEESGRVQVTFGYYF